MDDRKKSHVELLIKALKRIKKKKGKNKKASLHNLVKGKNLSHIPTTLGVKETLKEDNEFESELKDISDDQSTESSVSIKTSSDIDKCESCCSLRDIVAIDCEFVGCGPKAKINALGRVTIVDYHGNVIYDQVALPDRDIVDFRTRWSGLRPKDFRSAIPEEFVKNKVRQLLKDRIVVGHMLKNDFSALQYSHDRHFVRDTALYAPLRHLCGGDLTDRRPMALKKLTKLLLDRDIQTSEHDSCEDARASLELYKLVASSWETELHACGSVTVPSSSVLSSTSELTTENSETISWFDDQFWPE